MRFLIFLAILLGAAALWAQAYLDWKRSGDGAVAIHYEVTQEPLSEYECNQIRGAIAYFKRGLESYQSDLELHVASELLDASKAEQAADENAIRARARYLSSKGFQEGFYRIRSIIDGEYLVPSTIEEMDVDFSAYEDIPYAARRDFDYRINDSAATLTEEEAAQMIAGVEELIAELEVLQGACAGADQEDAS
ncbi:MAG: hypothetical protein AAFX08_04715 [Pseudomonadota bacterium]